MALRSRALDIPLPPSWDNFLKNIENKKELNEFLAKELVTRTDIGENKLFVATVNQKVFYQTSCSINTDTLQPCNHEEADTRMFLHALHVSEHGSLHVK